jgi:hypothetical protein
MSLKASIGPKKAFIACCCLDPNDRLSHAPRTCYCDLGLAYFSRRNPAKLAAKLTNRIRNLGYRVEISAAA